MANEATGCVELGIGVGVVMGQGITLPDQRKKQDQPQRLSFCANFRPTQTHWGSRGCHPLPLDMLARRRHLATEGIVTAAIAAAIA